MKDTSIHSMNLVEEMLEDNRSAITLWRDAQSKLHITLYSFFFSILLNAFLLGYIIFLK